MFVALAMLSLAPLAGIQAQPINDNFATRSTLVGTNLLVTNTVEAATSEAGEPFIPGVSSGQTAWWTWTAPANGIVTLGASAANFSPLLSVYTGSDLASLSLLATNNYISCYEYCGCHWREYPSLTFRVAKGQAYQIAADVAVETSATKGFISTTATNDDGEVIYLMTFGRIWTTNLPSGSAFALSLQFIPAPTNDDFSQPIVLKGARKHIVTSNAGATKEPGEPTHQTNSGGSSVWFVYTAPASGRVTITDTPPPHYAPPTSGTGNDGCVITWQDPFSCGSESPLAPLPSFYPVFAAYTGNSVTNLTSAGAIPMQLAAYSNGVCFDVVKGKTYHIAFDGNQGTTGNIDLYLALTQPASNDAFERRIKLKTIYALATSYNAGATHQVGEPAAGANSCGKTVWWTWTAPVSGITTIDLSGSDFAFPVAVFTGQNIKHLTQITSAEGSVTFNAIAGMTYQIAVSDLNGLTGEINLSLKAPIVSLSLKRQTRLGWSALLEYASETGQQVLLQRGVSNVWQNAQTVTARSSSVTFIAKPLPSATTPYRAIVVDRKF
jgi:hypothetical protein